MSTIDCITYNGEADLLEIRLNILDKYVDQFVICESPVTFSGHDKPLYFDRQFDRFGMWKDKIKYFVIDEEDNKLWKQAHLSKYTHGADHWKREWVQKESIKKALVHLKDDDLVFIGDCDEIWKPSYLPDKVIKLKLDVYTYYLNNRSNEEFWGTIVGEWKDIKNKCLNDLRNTAPKTNISRGWHFTSMAPELRRKLEDSYTTETYANDWVMRYLDKNIEERKDFLGRNFTYKVDESDWPQWLKANKDKYRHLLI